MKKEKKKYFYAKEFKNAQSYKDQNQKKCFQQKRKQNRLANQKKTNTDSENNIEILKLL